MTQVRRATSLAAAASLTAGALIGLSSPAGAAKPKCPALQGSNFSGSAHSAGIAQPTRTVGGETDAGAIEIVDTCSVAKPVALQLPTPHAGDKFGTSSVAANINSQINETTGAVKDAYDDLVIGVPGYDVGSKKDAGAVAIFLGSAKGLTFSKLITQDTPGIAGAAQAGAHFGATLTTDFVYDQPDITIRVGIPDLDVGSATDAGGVADLVANKYGTITSSTQLTENSAHVPGPAKAGDHFGAALWSLTEIGVPGKTVNGRAGAGAVVADAGSTDAVLWTQDSPCVAGTAEAGDHFGAAIADHWIGVPGEDIGTKTDAGMVNHVTDSDTNCYALTQDTAGVPGTTEAGDRFGATLGQNFNEVDEGYGGPYRLLIGAPGEDTSAKDAGTVVVAGVSDYDEDAGFEVYGFATVPNPHAVAGGAFGSSLSSATTVGALIGAPGDSAGRAYLFDTDADDNDDAAPKATRLATYTQATGTKGAGFGAGFSAFYAL